MKISEKIQAERTLEQIEANPLFKRFKQHVSRPGRHDVPWHALGARLYAASMTAWAVVHEEVEIDLFNLTKGTGLDINPELRPEFLNTITEWIMGATPFLWSHEIERIADASPLPKHIISKNLLPAPAMFWCFETASGCAKEGDLGNTNWLLALDVQEEEEGEAKYILTVFDKCQTDAAGYVTTWGLVICRLDYGMTWPDQLASQDAEGWGRFLKRCAFLNSPYVSKEKTRLARHDRRQLERAGEPPEKVEETVHVVKLRREVKAATKSSAQGDGPGIEYQHQWWVSGHYRAQWYPAEEAHRVIWIAPYLKGPGDKPLLEKVYAVVR